MQEFHNLGDYPNNAVNNFNNEVMDNTDKNNNEKNGTRIVQTDIGAIDGQNKCPKCGATDISLNPKTGFLRCNFCRHEFKPEKIEGLEDNISNLEGEVMASGAQDIVADTKDVLTFKCSSCGAEVVIDTASSTQARCHWCRNTLSVNQQIPNGAIPDVVLPFKVTKNEAREQMEQFVGKRKFYANTKFKQEFSTENIMGVYFPYMLVDVNSHVSLSGKGERQTREYYVGSGENRQKRYDADLYQVDRDFDLTINGLTLESNSDRLKMNSDKTNNIINAILPFDTENCVKYDSNYIKGYTSERRDTNVDELRPLVDKQSKDVAKFAANDTIKEYNRGVKWESENIDFKGKQWQTAYLPVWLYSYQEKKENKSIMHYVAVNARTKETMGSIPLNITKLILISIIVEIIGLIMNLLIDFKGDWILLLLGFIYFAIMFFRYRNLNARHHYETETKKNISNVKRVDRFIRSERNLSNARIEGANNNSISNNETTESIVNNLSNFGNDLGSIEDLKENGLDELKKFASKNIFKI